MALILAPRRLPHCSLLAASLLLGGCSHAAPQEPSLQPTAAALPPGLLLLASAPPPPSAPPPDSAPPPPDSAPQAAASAAPAVSAVAPPSSPSLALPASSSPAVTGPPCGSFSSGLGVNTPQEKARALALDYYRRTLRPRVRAWAKDRLEKSDPGSSRLIREMALQAPRVSSAEPVAETEAQKELDTYSSYQPPRVVCRAATVGNRALWRVIFYAELPSPPHVTDIGMALETFIDAASGEVVLVVYGPLLF